MKVVRRLVGDATPVEDGWEWLDTSDGVNVHCVNITFARYEEVAAPNVTMRQAMVNKLRAFAAEHPTAFSELARCARTGEHYRDGSVASDIRNASLEGERFNLPEKYEPVAYRVLPIVRDTILAHTRGDGLDLIFTDEDAL